MPRKKGPRPRYGTTMNDQVKFAVNDEQRSLLDTFAERNGMIPSDLFRTTLINIARENIMTGADEITVNLKTGEAKPAHEK